MGPDHAAAVAKVMRKVPYGIGFGESTVAEKILADAACSVTPEDVAELGAHLLACLNPDRGRPGRDGTPPPRPADRQTRHRPQDPDLRAPRPPDPRTARTGARDTRPARHEQPRRPRRPRPGTSNPTPWTGTPSRRPPPATPAPRRRWLREPDREAGSRQLPSLPDQGRHRVGQGAEPANGCERRRSEWPGPAGHGCRRR
nr:hypothetical protein [Rhodococcus zopfii]